LLYIFLNRFFPFPQRETDEYSSCFDGSDSALSSHLTKEELEHYTRIYEEKSTSQISLTEKTVPSHQHQTSYAQSEGYHSYVSSTDSTSTPFLDRYIFNIIRFKNVEKYFESNQFSDFSFLNTMVNLFSG